MTDVIYQKFFKRAQTVLELPPQTLGPLTPYYKILVKRLKVMPWPALVIISVLLIIGLYFLIGSAVVVLTSFLQRGF